MQAHEVASALQLSLDAVDSWEAAYARVTRIVPGLQKAGKGPVVALAQTGRSAAALQQLCPALKMLPLIEVPHNRADGAAFDDRSLLLGGAWQPAALGLALSRFADIAPWWESRLDLARYASVPVGCLPSDALVFAADVLLQRKLLLGGHLSWLSPSPSPDLGGHPCHTALGGVAEEMSSPEVSLPGMYRTVCIELHIGGLAVNTVLEAKHVHSLERVDLMKDMVSTGEGGIGGASEVEDEATACASAFRLFKYLVQEWMRDVVSHGFGQADELLMNAYRWVSSSSSLLYDPALHRMIQMLMKKVWLQLIAELRSLGARVVFSNFTRMTIATDKMSLADANTYLDFLLASIK